MGGKIRGAAEGLGCVDLFVFSGIDPVLKDVEPHILAGMCSVCQHGLIGCGWAPVGHAFSESVNKQNPGCSLLIPVARVPFYTISRKSELSQVPLHPESPPDSTVLPSQQGVDTV